MGLRPPNTVARYAGDRLVDDRIDDRREIFSDLQWGVKGGDGDDGASRLDSGQGPDVPREPYAFNVSRVRV